MKNTDQFSGGQGSHFNLFLSRMSGRDHRETLTSSVTTLYYIVDQIYNEFKDRMSEEESIKLNPQTVCENMNFELYALIIMRYYPNSEISSQFLENIVSLERIFRNTAVGMKYELKSIVALIVKFESFSFQPEVTMNNTEQ